MFCGGFESVFGICGESDSGGLVPGRYLKLFPTNCTNMLSKFAAGLMKSVLLKLRFWRKAG